MMSEKYLLHLVRLLIWTCQKMKSLEPTKDTLSLNIKRLRLVHRMNRAFVKVYGYFVGGK